MHSNDMTCFKEPESYLRSLYQNSFVHVENPKQVEMTKPLQAINAKSCLKKFQTQFQEFFDSEEVTSSAGIASPILQENFKDYMGCKPETYRSNLLKYLDILAKCIDKSVYKYYEILKSFKLQSKDVLINSIQAVGASLVFTESSGLESENNSSENALSKSVSETQMQMQEVKVDMGKELDDGLVVTESSETESDKQDTNSKLGNDITHVVDVDIRPVYDQVPFDEVQLTTQHNVFASEQQHFVQFEPIYDTHLLEKIDSNTTPDSINMCHRGGEID
ncbi:hypothetical protein Tco_0763804 [Tanacetum coccineum]